VALGLQAVAFTDLDSMQRYLSDSRNTTGWLLFTLLAVLWQWLYYALMESSGRQATLGKMAMRLKVTDLEGRKLSFAQASGRFLGKGVANIAAGVVVFVGSLGSTAGMNPNASDPSGVFTREALSGVLGALLLALLIIFGSNLMAAFTARRQALQDLVSRCLVLRQPSD
jgi:uncharacterized RDD family membrane protein YckC